MRNDLADFKAVKDAFGGTVNDVVLTVVSGALRAWLHSRGVRTEGLELRALVPVSIRAHDQRGTTGNRIAAMRGPLPVYVEDPIARLRAVKAGMDGLKESKQAVGAEVLASVQNFAPPTILAQASRLNFSTRLFNLIVTNVPGPQFPLYVRGREMLDVFPVAFLPKDHALAVAIMSYNGRMNFGLLGDYDALPDIDDDRRGHPGLAGRAAGPRARGAPRTRARAGERLAPAHDPRVGLLRAPPRGCRRGRWRRCRSGSGRRGAGSTRRAVRVVENRRLNGRRRRAPQLEARDARGAHAGRRPVGRVQRTRDRALGRARGQPHDPRGRRAAIDAGGAGQRGAGVEDPPAQVGGPAARGPARGLLDEAHDRRRR